MTEKQLDEEFDELWSLWLPRRNGRRCVKSGKKAARAEYGRARQRATFEEIRDGVLLFRKYPPEPEYVPDFRKFLYNDQWEDEYETTDAIEQRRQANMKLYAEAKRRWGMA